jgi:hypothetical protein
MPLMWRCGIPLRLSIIKCSTLVSSEMNLKQITRSILVEIDVMENHLAVITHFRVNWRLQK